MSSAHADTRRPQSPTPWLIAAAAPASILWLTLVDLILSGSSSGVAAGYMSAAHAPLLVGCLPLAVATQIYRRGTWMRHVAIWLSTALVITYCLWPMRYEPTITGRAVFTAAACGGWALLTALVYWSVAAAARRSEASRWAVALGFALLAATLLGVNNWILPCQYLGFHQSLLRLAMVGFLASALLGGVSSAGSRLRIAWYAQAALGAALVVGGFVWAQGARRSDFYLYSGVGRALVPVVAAQRGGTDDGVALAAGSALATFSRYNGYPAVDVALSDYNVLIVMVEAMRADATTLVLPAANARVTPNLARLAHSSLVFGRAYASAPGTFQSLASFFSMVPAAMAPIDVWAKVWHGRLRPERLWAPQLLRKSGWETIWIGHDFHEIFSRRKIRGFRRGFTRFEVHRGDARLRERIVAALGRRARSRRRFMMFTFFAAPHAPYERHYADMPSSNRAQRYRHEVRFADEQIGKILDAVETTSLAKNTIVIVASDHGEALGEHGRFDHNSNVHVEQVHVPLLVRIPGVAARRINDPVALYALLPWLMLRGPAAMRGPVRRLVREDLGPLYEVTRGAAVSDFIGHHFMFSALRFTSHTLVADLGLRRIDRYRDASEAIRLQPTAVDLAFAARYLRFRTGRRRFRRRRLTTWTTAH